MELMHTIFFPVLHWISDDVNSPIFNWEGGIFSFSDQSKLSEAMQIYFYHEKGGRMATLGKKNSSNVFS